jgi:hypothetical protein
VSVWVPTFVTAVATKATRATRRDNHAVSRLSERINERKLHAGVFALTGPKRDQEEWGD